MKKLIGIFMIMLAMGFAGMQSANAQWDVTIEWMDNCSGCPTVGGYEYYVCLQIDDTCKNTTPYTQNCVVKDSTSSSYTFYIGSICGIDEYTPCFKISYAVIKRCINSQSTICQVGGVIYRRCKQIYNNILIDITLN